MLVPCWCRAGTVFVPCLFRVWYRIGTVLVPCLFRVCSVIVPCLYRVVFRVCTVFVPCLFRVGSLKCALFLILVSTSEAVGLFGFFDTFFNFIRSGSFWVFYTFSTL